MDLADIKRRHGRDWASLQRMHGTDGAQRECPSILRDRGQLIAEVERLTALCDGYRGEVAALKVENGRLREELGEEEHDIPLTDKLAMSESVAEQWMSRAEQAESALTRARAEGLEDKADAERWRAVIGCARVRALGCAGIINRREDGYAHIGVELWTRHEAGSEPMAIEWLTAFADIAVSLRATKGDGDEG